MCDPTKTSPLLPPTSLARLLAHVVEPSGVLCFELRSAVATPPAVAAGSNRLGQERAVERGSELVQQLIQILPRARPAAHLNRIAESGATARQAALAVGSGRACHTVAVETALATTCAGGRLRRVATA